MITVGLGKFIQQNTKPSIFNGDWEKVRLEVENIINHYFLKPMTRDFSLTGRNDNKVNNGYRKGVFLVSIDPTNFYTPVIVLKKGQSFSGKFESRIEGEEPRKKSFVQGYTGKHLKYTPAHAKKVNIIIYHRKVLLETHLPEEVGPEDFEMVAVQALPTEDDAPMDPQTLIYNHFKLSGGTSTQMDSVEFEVALKESFIYWKDKILCY